MKYIGWFILWHFSLGGISQSVPYKDAQLPIEVRVQDLLSRMTKEEKFYQLFMIAHDAAFDSTNYQNGIFGIEISIEGMDDSPGQQMLNYNAKWTAKKQVEEINRIQMFLVEHTRLGIPAIFYGEALHGVVGKDGICYPQSIALAASFDTTLMQNVAKAIALESQQRGWRQVLSPVVNIATDVRWGRVEETYGEDPYLSSAMGAAFVRPFEQLGIITTPKHFVANVGDGGRDSYPIHLDDGYLKNVHFPPFKACLNAGSRSIMSSYNSLNGRPCSMNSELLNVVLKDQWKFDGFVISDAGAVGGANVLHNTSLDYPHSGKMAIENGLDVIFQTSIRHDVLFRSPFIEGSVRQSAVDSAVARVLRAKFQLGLFENPYASFQELNNVRFQEVCRQAAEQSMVLLKNDGLVCPIAVSGKKILVVGEEAKLCRLGGYSGTGLDPISYWDGMQEQWKGEAELIYHPGWNQQAKWEEWNPGWDLKWWNNLDAKGDANWKEVRPSLNFKYTFIDPNDSIRRDFFSLKASTLIVPNDDRDFSIQISGNDGYKVWMNNELVIDHGDKISYHEDVLDIHAQKNVPIFLDIEYKESFGNPELHVLKKTEEKQSKLSSLREAAKSADYVIVFAGIKEGEFQDRSRLSLSPEAEEVLASLKDIQNPIIVALTGGSAITMEKWKEDVDVIWMNWYGGEQQGEAFANLLTGKVDPSGRLPITFPVHEGQLPLSYWHEPTGRGDDYVDGSGLPLFPFGYGMSYAKFEWSDLMWEDEDHQTMSMTVKNISQRDGYEVVQLYMQTKNGTILQPVIRLVGEQKLFLKSNQEQKVIFAVSDIAKFLALSDISITGLNAQWAVGTSSRSLISKLSSQ